jgi:hypothetical protein
VISNTETVIVVDICWNFFGCCGFPSSNVILEKNVIWNVIRQGQGTRTRVQDHLGFMLHRILRRKRSLKIRKWLRLNLVMTYLLVHCNFFESFMICSFWYMDFIWHIPVGFCMLHYLSSLSDYLSLIIIEVLNPDRNLW